MTESKDQEQQRALDELKAKNVAHYSVMLAAFINARVEANKSIFAFSSTGIGFLIAVQNKLQDVCVYDTFAYIGALVSFFVAASSTLFVFAHNANAIESYIRGEGKEKTMDFKLNTWKYVNYYSFGVGLLLSLIFSARRFF